MATRHEPNVRQASDDAAKPKSQPLQATLTQGHPNGIPPTKETSASVRLSPFLGSFLF